MRESEVQELKKRISELEDQIADLIVSKDVLEAITGTSEDSIFIKGIDLRYTFVNPAMERALGLPASELIGKTPEEVFGKEEARIIADIDKPVLEGQAINARRTLVINGIERTFHTVQTPVLDSNGKVKAICGIVRDVTSLQKAEERLRFLSIITEQVTDSIVTTDTDFQITYINKAFTNLYGYSIEEVLGKSPDFLNVDPMSSEIQSEIYKKISAGEVYKGEAMNLRKDGSIFPCDMIIFPLLDENGNIFAYVGNQRDITERKITEDALRQAKAHAEHLIETANAMVVGLDSEGDITIFNKAAEKITGYSREELKNKNWFEVIAPKDRYPKVWEQFEKIWTGDLPRNFENPILSKSGEERYIVWQNSEVRERGEIVGTLSFGVDITERKEAEEALRMSEEKLRAYNEELRVERQALHQKNIALKEVLEQIEAGKEQLASQIKSNVDRVIMPIINGLADKQHGDIGGYINLLKDSLSDIISPFIGHLESEFSRLTSRQIEICNMVKNGMSCKEIAASLNISVQTVLKQRTLVRKKLGIANKKINLASYLKSMNKTGK
jgi:PAS domain S-box-containing protein